MKAARDAGPPVSASQRARRGTVFRCAFGLHVAGRSPTAARAQTYLTFQGQVRPNPSHNATLKPKDGDQQMLVQADEIQYDYNNELVSAVGNVQIYYNGATIEADKVIYDQRTKRLHAEGNARLDRAGRQDHLRRPARPRATTSATASSIRCVSRRPTTRAWRRRAPTAPAPITRCSRAASIPPASRVRTILASRRFGRSRRSASSTTKPRR